MSLTNKRPKQRKMQVGDLVKLDHLPDDLFVIFSNRISHPPAVAVMNVKDNDICFCLHTNYIRTQPLSGWKVIGTDRSYLPSFILFPESNSDRRKISGKEAHAMEASSHTNFRKWSAVDKTRKENLKRKAEKHG